MQGHMARDSEWITVKEMQQILSIGRSTAYAICAEEEELEIAQIRTSIRVNRKSLERWLQGQSYPK
jgi:excisionase family DNA binding protein